MFAVIKTGGKQYKVAKNDILTVEKLAAEVGATVTLDDVLLVGGDGAAPSVGTPGVDKARVQAEVVDQGKNRTITVFKKKRRKNYRRSNGHRQLHTKLRITDIALDGKAAAESDEKKAQQASQKAGARAQKQATQKATTEKSKAKSATTKTRSTQAKAGGTAKSKSAESASGQTKSGQSKSAQSKSGGGKSAKAGGAKSGGSKSSSAKSGGAKSSGGQTKKSEE